MPHDANESSEAGRTSEMFVVALRDAFGSRAVEVAERQQRLANSGHVARTWQLIAEMLRQTPTGTDG